MQILFLSFFSRPYLAWMILSTSEAVQLKYIELPWQMYLILMSLYGSVSLTLGSPKQRWIRTLKKIKSPLSKKNFKEMNKWIHTWTNNKCMDEWMIECLSEWPNELMKPQMDGYFPYKALALHYIRLRIDLQLFKLLFRNATILIFS